LDGIYAGGEGVCKLGEATIVSCLIYLIDYIRVKLGDFYRIYLTFYQKVHFDKFLERVNNLVYSNVINSDNGVVSLSVKSKKKQLKATSVAIIYIKNAINK